MGLSWCADAQALNNDSQLPAEYASSSAMQALIRDAVNAGGRCQCDCGAYTPGPFFASLNWKGGCSATVKCHMDPSETNTEPVRCVVTNTVPGWSPPSPIMACSALTSRSVPACRPWTVGLTLVMASLVLLPQRIHGIGLLRPVGTV